MSDLVAALRELHLASGDKFSMWSKAADRIESLQMIYDDAEKQSAEARIELVIFKQGALARIEALEAELAAVRLDIIIFKNNYAVGAEEEERLESELAEANAKIKLVYDYDSNLIDALERRALSATPQGSLAGDDMSDKRSTIYKCVCQFSGTNVKTRKYGDDDYWTCPRCQIEYGPMLPYSLGPQRPFAGSTIREENGTTGGGPIVDPEC